MTKPTNEAPLPPDTPTDNSPPAAGASKGDEHLRRLLGPKAPRMPVVMEPEPLPIDEDLPLDSISASASAEDLPPSENPDDLAAAMRRTGASREELEELARNLGF